MAGRAQRKRKVAERVSEVSATDLAAARARRLDALEADADDTHDANDAAASDDEFVPLGGAEDASDEELLRDMTVAAAGQSKRGAASKRRRRSTRGQRDGPKSARAQGIEKWNKSLIDAVDEDIRNKVARAGCDYYSIAAPPSPHPPRKLCSVCGFRAPYTCTRCRVRFCSLRCGKIHEETRCLKYTL